MSKSVQLELLAPAGQWKVLTAVVKAGADAIYAGGKNFNMRGLRPDMNFSNEQIKSAVAYLHDNGKKLYITVNNLYFEHELHQFQEHLEFLAGAGVDALIVQDLATAQICREMSLNLPLHASVQMGISNLEAVKALEEEGFDRVILSKDVTWEEIKMIRQGSPMGIEFFAHGDLCISHTGQCYMSTFLASEPGNRGKCIKPCRWEYTLLQDNKTAMQGYLLAHNDLCLYPYLQEMVEAGVSSFKIEGRMRSAKYLAGIIQIYRRALDKIIENPSTYYTNEADMQQLYMNRIRDFSSANLFKRTDLGSIGITGEREPFFISTGFSGKPPLSEDSNFSEFGFKDYTQTNKPASDSMDKPKQLHFEGGIQEISVKAGNLKAVEALAEMGVTRIIIECEQMRQGNNGWTANKINKAIEHLFESRVQLLIESPRILSQPDMADFKLTLERIHRSGVHAIIANDLGAIKLARALDYQVWGGYGLNITNSAAARFYLNLDLQRITASQELQINELALLAQNEKELEVMVHGPLCGMISDYCIIKAANNDPEECSNFCTPGHYVLKDGCNQVYQLRTDMHCRCYIFYPHHLCLLTQLPLLSTAGIKNIRIEGQYYDLETLKEVTSIYINAVKALNSGKWERKRDLNRLISLIPQGLTTAPTF